jgi:glucose-6-phosphate dehydrogenase assembly protein OpcA
VEEHLMPPAAAVAPDKILRELRDQWEQLGRDQEPSGGVLRACAMTLIAAIDSGAAGADADSVRQTIGVLMHDHPSRAIMLIPSEGGEIGARVFAECWMPLGGQRQICAEGIEITADPVQSSEVARLLVPLIAPDLPAVLWCRGARAFLDRSLDPLFPLADKIIFDTGSARHAPSAIEFLRRLRKEGRGVADLAWTRLTGWREIVAHFFDDGLVDAHSVTSVRLTHGGAAPGSSVLYLERWIERALPRAQVMVEPAGEAAGGEPGPRGVAFSADGADFSIQLLDGSSVEVRGGGHSALSLLPPASVDALMREELSLLGTDPVFDRVLG